MSAHARNKKSEMKSEYNLLYHLFVRLGKQAKIRAPGCERKLWTELVSNTPTPPTPYTINNCCDAAKPNNWTEGTKEANLELYN